MKRNILAALVLSLLLTLCLTATAQAEEMTIPNGKWGFVLQNGVTYHVTVDTEVVNLKVANNATVKIIIDSGVTLTASGTCGTDGSNETAGTGGSAGIYLPKGSVLILDGGGTLNAIGGDGGDGTNGTDGHLWTYADVPDSVIEVLKTIDGADYYGGIGGKGGAGAGGGGAGIGTNGGTGAQPGSKLGRGCAFDFDLCTNGRDWTYGSTGVAGASTGASGDVYNYGVTVNATGGKSGSAGTAGSGGRKHTIKPSYKVDFGKLGEWDVRETYICNGEGGGAGQAGAAGCAIGPGGGGGGSGHNGNGGAGQCSRNFAAVVNTLSYGPGTAPADGATGARGACGTYHVYDGTSFNKGSAAGISAGSVGSDVDHMSYMTIDVKLDDEFYEAQEVYLWNDEAGKVALNELNDTAVGQYFVYIHRDSKVYKIYVDDVYSGCTVKPNAAAPATVTADYYTVSANIRNGDEAWQNQTALLAGGGKVQSLRYQSTGTFAGKYTAILPLTDTTNYQLRVNGTAYENEIQVNIKSKRTTEIDFFDAAITTRLNGVATASDVFSVMLKQGGKTIRVMDRDTQSNNFTAVGLLEGTYDVFVYGTASAADKNTTVSLGDSAKSFDYYTIHFRRNTDDTTTDCRTQYRASGDTITLASTPYTPGYTFAGWKTDAAGTADYTPGTATAETFVYASWLKPQVTLGTSVRCDENGTVSGAGTCFRLPNLAVQGYPQSGKVIHTFTVNLNNVEEVAVSGEEVTIAGRTWTRSTTTYDEESASGIILYRAKTADDYLTVAQTQAYLRSAVYQLKEDTQSGSIKLQTYGNTNA